MPTTSSPVANPFLTAEAEADDQTMFQAGPITVGANHGQPGT